MNPSTPSGARAEAKVFTALAKLPSPWLVFETVEWRALHSHGVSVGEADVVVFHPGYGVVVIEVKAGAVEVRAGVWFYGSGVQMKQSPFAQARRNLYALSDKLAQRLGRGGLEGLVFAAAVWFPDVVWRAALPGPDVPSRAFLLDRTTLADPAAALLRLFRDAAPQAAAWSPAQQRGLRDVLAPDCHCLVPLASRVDEAVGELHRATAQQVAVLRALRLQPRLLVEGGAGSGKTLLACALAREHAALGRSVLLTCYNKALAQFLALALADVPGVTVLAFHELARTLAEAAGLAYVVPTDGAAAARFYQEDSVELLMQAAELGAAQYDSLIVDEAADFAPTWWVALEALGTSGVSGFSWYCFYDRQQSIFQAASEWVAPFQAAPMVLDTNLRNTQPIGKLAANWGRCTLPMAFKVLEGDAPVLLFSPSFAQMAGQLRKLLADLMLRQALAPEQIAVLSPYRSDNANATWVEGLAGYTVNRDVACTVPGQLRLGTVQGFKGLEADVVILVGLDARACQRADTLYVGASRARAALFVLVLEGAGLTAAL